MFGIGTWEIALVCLVVLLIYGPDKLPQVIRKVVMFMRDAKKISTAVTVAVRREVNNLERIAQLDELKKQSSAMVEETRSVASELQNIGKAPEKTITADPEKTLVETTLPDKGSE